LVDEFLIKKMGFPSVFKLMIESQKKIKGYYGFFLVVILAPVVEELIFRLILVPKRRNIAIFTFAFSFLIINKTYYLIEIDWLLLMSLAVSGLLSFLVFKLLKRKPEIETVIGKRQKITTIVSVVLFGLLHIANIENLHWELVLLYPVYALPQMISGYVCSVQRLKLGFIWGLLFHSMINLMAFLN
jgi:membrane protein